MSHALDSPAEQVPDTPMAEEISDPDGSQPPQTPAAPPDPPDAELIRELILQAHPDVVPELVQGTTLQELLASLPAAQEAWRNAVERLFIMTPSDSIRVDDLPGEIRATDVGPRSPADAEGAARAADSSPAGAGTLREFKDASERAYLVQKLRETNWNISRTAEIIDTPRSNLYKKLEQYGIKQEIDG